MIGAILAGALIGQLVGNGLRAAIDAPKTVYTFGDIAAVTEQWNGADGIPYHVDAK